MTHDYLVIVVGSVINAFLLALVLYVAWRMV
jgi:hypothetical protein